MVRHIAITGESSVMANGRAGFLDCMDRLKRDFDLPQRAWRAAHERFIHFFALIIQES